MQSSEDMKIQQKKDKYELPPLEQTGICPYCGAPVMGRKMFGGWINVECECRRKVREEEERQEAERDRWLMIERNKRESGIPPRQRGCTLASFEEREGTGKALQAARRYIEVFEEMSSRGEGLLFAGPTGCGKTHLAAAIGNALLEDGRRVVFKRVTDLYYELRGSFDGGRNFETDIITPCRQADLLILDDLGVDAPTPWTRSVLQSLVDYRVNYYRPMVVTTNLRDTAALREAVDSRTVDRLESCCHRFVMAAPSYRRLRHDG